MPPPHASRRRRVAVVLESLEDRKLLNGSKHDAPTPAAESRVLGVTPRRWAWLKDTYWYVPTPNVPATLFNPATGALATVRDQTVYHVTGYKRGYFWGETVAQFGSGTPTGSSLVGSVTPQGRVLLSFTSSSGKTQGYGTMVRKGGQWTMENQMFTGGQDGPMIGHWAYMVQTRPGMKSWRRLPSAGVSVPTFLANNTLPPPTPVAG